MNVLRAVKWGIKAWDFAVSEETIKNYLIKSTITGVIYGPAPAPSG